MSEYSTRAAPSLREKRVLPSRRLKGISNRERNQIGVEISSHMQILVEPFESSWYP
jgi:hypothetical protein